MKIEIKNATVEFPTYDADRSFKKMVFRATVGGNVRQQSNSVINVRALDSVSMSLKEGDRVGLVGHNGSGKSTLLRLISGAYEPIKGSVSVKGNINSLLDISLGMDERASGYDNILLRGLMMGFSRKQILEKMDEIVEFSELGQFLSMPLRTYSSGMKMRLGVAVSMSLPTDILLMDEWLSVGDENFQKKASLKISELIKNSKILVIASHSKEIIHDLCNKIYYMKHGIISETPFDD